MSEVKKIATRASYGAALVELGKEHEDLVVLDADLAAATQTGIFKKEFPERHIDCGIAECNMMGIAAGLATTGKVPFASTFAMFAAGRAYEQLRNSVAYPKLNVKVGATHGGISVGEDGATHQCCEDFALMRAIPGMVVMSPSDDIEAKAMVKAAYEHVGPVYMRFGRLAVPVINDRPDYKFELGKGIVLREGKDLTIIANGLCVAPALEAAEKLAADGVDAKVINIHTIKPLDEELVVAAAKETGKVVTVEEHSVIGGLGGAVCECLSEKAPVPVKRIGVNDVFGESGPATALLEKYGLDAEGIYKQIKEFVLAGKAYDNGEAYDNIREQYQKDGDEEKYDKAIDELCKNGGFLSGAGSGKFTTDFGDWLSLLVMESYDNIKKDYLDNSIARTAKYKVIVEFFKKYNWDIQAAGNKFRQKYNEYKATLPPPVEDDEEE